MDQHLRDTRSRLIVDRPTPAVSAAALTVVSPRTNCNQISHFTDGANNFFTRCCGPPHSPGHPGSDYSSTLTFGSGRDPYSVV